jgi:O-antigen/teichoic acid export membrane protein
MAWFFLAQFAAAVLTLVSFMIMTRALSPEGFGAYNMTVLSATTAYFFLLAWVPMSVNRFNSAKQFEGRASAAAFGGGGLVFLVAIPLLVAAQALGPESWRLPLLLGALFWVAQSISEAGLSGLRVLGEGPRFAGAVVLRPIIGTILAILLVAVGFGYPGAIIGMAIGSLAAGLYALVLSIRRLRIAMPNLAALRTFLGFGMPLAFVSSSSTVAVLITQAILAQGAGLAAVGIYAAAQTLVLRGVTMPMSMLSSAVAPRIFHAFEAEGDEAVRQALDRHFSFLMLVAVPIAGVMGASNDTVAHLLFDKSFQEEVARYLPILAFAALLIGVQGAYYDYPFMISRRTHVQLLLSAAVVAVHAVLAFGLIFALGGIGAAWAILASAVLGLVAYRAVGRRIRVMPVPRDELRKAVVAVLAAAPLALLADHLGMPLLSPALVALAAVAYVAALAAQGQIATRLILARLRGTEGARGRLGR